MITDINSIYHQFYKMTEIFINNKRIAEFCKKYNNFDITQTLLSFIDFIEHNTKMPSLDSTLAMQILDNIKSLQNQVSSIDSTLSVKQKEIKNEYIDDLKTMMMMNNNEKIIPIIKEYNEAFFNKLSIMIPKEQQQQAVQLQLILKNIEQSVVIEMNKGITQNSIDQMMISIEQKFATILTHSEQKITNVLTAVSENKKDDLILHSKLDQMLTKLGKNNEKGKVSENLLYGNLQNIYPTAEIRNMSQTPHAGDFWILRKDKPTILVENKNHDGTVYTGGVQKFIDDMEKLQNVVCCLNKHLQVVVDTEHIIKRNCLGNLYKYDRTFYRHWFDPVLGKKSNIVGVIRNCRIMRGEIIQRLSLPRRLC